MPEPVILAVDDDPAVLNALTRDLRRRYGERYRVVSAGSSASAWDTVQQLKQREEAVALYLVDLHMPERSGVEFLAQVCALYPNAKRVLLAAYADTQAAVQAINAAAVHYFLLKPWDPPEEKLYPVLDDLLEDWQATYRPPFQGLRVIAHRWSPEAHEIKEFLARNHIPYQSLDIELDAEAGRLADQIGIDLKKLPAVVYPDGAWAYCPSTTELAEKAGLKQQAEQPFYDIVIVGGGPAGLAAAVYAASEGLRTVLIEREAPGGQAGTSARIENYLGFPSGLSGADLARRAVAQAQRFGVEILTPMEATGLRVEGNYRMVRLSDGSELACHALILAIGLEYRSLPIDGCAHLRGAGFFYGATLTEALPCEEQDVFIVGAGNSAGQAAVYLSGYARSVTMVVRGPSIAAKMSQYLVDRIEGIPNIRVWTESEIRAVQGQEHVEAVTVRHNASGEEETLPAAAVFAFIGARPCTAWLRGILAMDEWGFLLAGPQLKAAGPEASPWPEARDPFLFETNLPGVFVVGDARSRSVKRIASAVGEGSVAVQFVHQYLSKVR